jgi:hypothetical protein
MDNAVLDRVLVSQKPNAHDGCAESLKALDQAKYEGDLASARDELVRLLI